MDSKLSTVGAFRNPAHRIPCRLFSGIACIPLLRSHALASCACKRERCPHSSNTSQCAVIPHPQQNTLPDAHLCHLAVTILAVEDGLPLLNIVAFDDTDGTVFAEEASFVVARVKIITRIVRPVHAFLPLQDKAIN